MAVMQVVRGGSLIPNHGHEPFKENRSSINNNNPHLHFKEKCPMYKPQVVQEDTSSRGRRSRLIIASSMNTSQRLSNKLEEKFIDKETTQEFHVYELNEGDRDSPAYLPLSLKLDLRKFPPVGAIGDLVPFSNKVYDGTLETRLGITAGICVYISYDPDKKGDRYEAIFSFHLGPHGHISVQGPYITTEDSTLAVTGGSGIFAGVRGTVHLHQVVYPTKLFYTFYLQGIPKLPSELTGKPVPPSRKVKPSPSASIIRESYSD